MSVGSGRDYCQRALHSSARLQKSVTVFCAGWVYNRVFLTSGYVMSISLYAASVPVFQQMLNALSDVLTKAEAYATEKKIQPPALLQARLFPDMLPFTRQVQIAVDFAKGASARLAGVEIPQYDDTETTFAELQALLAKTLAFIGSITPEQVDGKESIEIVLRPGTEKEKRLNGQAYLLSYALPQFFFHVTTAYDLLRHNGVEIGKRDFMGKF
ncbi:Uncharacterized protein ALO86_05646 [Pseudomonas syringae pv. berberidis]|nr:Uncharacterized protein ALO86_05646 [Pseudomonas syringae pv. berberidis]RMN51200.1 hypothetical protein ALQ58_05313 [Pseudomonas syringae pv. apii]RMP35459.1 hypothetical protein ALQ23_04731 [Pseudomonas syringae pv. antirrhini]